MIKSFLRFCFLLQQFLFNQSSTLCKTFDIIDNMIQKLQSFQQSLPFPPENCKNRISSDLKCKLEIGTGIWLQISDRLVVNVCGQYLKNNQQSKNSKSIEKQYGKQDMKADLLEPNSEQFSNGQNQCWNIQNCKIINQWNKQLISLLHTSHPNRVNNWPIFQPTDSNSEFSYLIKCPTCCSQYKHILQISNSFDINVLNQLLTKNYSNSVIFKSLLNAYVKICIQMLNTNESSRIFQQFSKINIYVLLCQKCDEFSAMFTQSIIKYGHNKQKSGNPYYTNKINNFMEAMEGLFNSEQVHQNLKDVGRIINEFKQLQQIVVLTNIASNLEHEEADKKQIRTYIFNKQNQSEVKSPFQHTKNSLNIRDSNQTTNDSNSKINFSTSSFEYEGASFDKGCPQQSTLNINTALKYSQYNSYSIDLNSIINKSKKVQHGFYKVKNGRKLLSQRNRKSQRNLKKSQTFTSFNLDNFMLKAAQNPNQTITTKQYSTQKSHQQPDKNNQSQYKNKPKREEQYKCYRFKTLGNDQNQIPIKQCNRKTSNIKFAAKKGNSKMIQQDQRPNKYTKQYKAIERVIRSYMLSFEHIHDDNLKTKYEKNKEKYLEIDEISKEIKKKYIDSQQKISSNKLIKEQREKQLAPVINSEDLRKTSKNTIHIEESMPQGIQYTSISKQTGVQNEDRFIHATKNTSTLINMETPQLSFENIWHQVQHQLLSNINYIGQNINQIREMFKQYNIKTLTQIYLLYKKFFYMRTAFISALKDQNKPILHTITKKKWQIIQNCSDYQNKIKEIQEENFQIYENLQKFQKKVQKQKKHFPNTINSHILEIIIENQHVYQQFVHQMLQLNLIRLKQIFILSKTIANSTQTEQMALKKYSNMIILGNLDEINEKYHREVYEWTRQSIQKTYIEVRIKQIERIKEYIGLCELK